MLSFMSNNIATIIISVILLAIAFIAIKELFKSHKSGSSIGCGNDCSHCGHCAGIQDKK